MAAEEATRPRILMISLDYRPFFDELYAPLLTELGSKASLQRVKKAQPAIRLLAEQPQLSVVLITDEALTVTANARVWEAVLQYVRQGGTAVIMGHFPTYVKPLSVKPFFAKAGLPWESGSYHRTTLVLNRDAVTNDLATKLPPQYSQKAVHVKNVASADAWYHSDERSVIESRVFAPTSAHIVGEAAVALARIGHGKLGYVGDVNAEKSSDAVILAMCGL